MELTVGRIIHVRVQEGCLAGIVNEVSGDGKVGVTIFPSHGPMLEAARRDDTELSRIHDPRTCPQNSLTIPDKYEGTNEDRPLKWEDVLRAKVPPEQEEAAAASRKELEDSLERFFRYDQCASPTCWCKEDADE